MRKFVLSLAIAALLALPGLAFGSPGGTISVKSGGNTSISIDKSVTEITIDVILVSDSAAGTVMYCLTADDGGGISSGDADWDYKTGGFSNGDFMDLVDWDNGGRPSSMGGVDIQGLPLEAAHDPDIIAGGSGTPGYAFMYQGPADNVTDTPAGTYTVCSYVLLSPQTVGSWDISAKEGPGGVDYFGIGVGGSAGFSGGTDLTVDITPEPATALLLLGALPFLRRRR